MFTLLAWALHDLNGPYLAAASAFALVEVVGLFVWPIARGWRRRAASSSS